jgi:DNA-binding transcriptional regulator YbjK
MTAAGRRKARNPAPSGAVARRRAILEAARRVVARGGTDSLTHRSVAAEAGVPLGSTTYYFESREALLHETFLSHVDLVYSALSSLAQRFRLETGAGIVEFLIEFERCVLLDPTLIPVEYEFIVAAGRNPALAAEVNAYEHTQTSILAEALERLGAAQAVDAARILMSVVRGYELEGITRSRRVEADLRRRLERVVTALIAPAQSSNTKEIARDKTRLRQ